MLAVVLINPVLLIAPNTPIAALTLAVVLINPVELWLPLTVKPLNMPPAANILALVLI
jgi:hypothetical protein